MQTFFVSSLQGQFCTGKSLSEALIFALISPQYDNILFMQLRIQYMETTTVVHEHKMLFLKQ